MFCCSLISLVYHLYSLPAFFFCASRRRRRRRLRSLFFLSFFSFFLSFFLSLYSFFLRSFLLLSSWPGMASQKELVIDVGAARPVRVQRRAVEEETEATVESCLFDDEFGIEAFTGLTVWDATWCLVALLQAAPLAARVAAGARVLELGAGIGAVGLAAAARGAHVVLTDLPSVVAAMLQPNIALNAEAAAAAAPGAQWLGVPLPGGGSAQAHVLDWSKPVTAQVERKEERKKERKKERRRKRRRRRRRE